MRDVLRADATLPWVATTQRKAKPFSMSRRSPSHAPMASGSGLLCVRIRKRPATAGSAASDAARRRVLEHLAQVPRQLRVEVRAPDRGARRGRGGFGDGRSGSRLAGAHYRPGRVPGTPAGRRPGAPSTIQGGRSPKEVANAGRRPGPRRDRVVGSTSSTRDASLGVYSPTSLKSTSPSAERHLGLVVGTRPAGGCRSSSRRRSRATLPGRASHRVPAVDATGVVPVAEPF